MWHVIFSSAGSYFCFSNKTSCQLDVATPAGRSLVHSIPLMRQKWGLSGWMVETCRTMMKHVETWCPSQQSEDTTPNLRGMLQTWIAGIHCALQGFCKEVPSRSWTTARHRPRPLEKLKAFWDSAVCWPKLVATKAERIRRRSDSGEKWISDITKYDIWCWPNVMFCDFTSHWRGIYETYFHRVFLVRLFFGRWGSHSDLNQLWALCH